MYTEENEFNYDDYLEHEGNYNKKPFIDFKFILKLLLIIILVVLIIFLVFKIRNKNINKNNGKEKNDDVINNSALVMNDNMSLIRDASHAYFFENNNLPSTISESKRVNVKELIANELMISLKDSRGNVCGYNTSGSTITKNRNDYQLTVNLSCATERDEKTYYYDLDGKCLTCNGEIYNPPVEEVKEDNKQEENNNNNTTNNNDNNNNNNACGMYSEWTSNYNNDSNLEVESRTLVKAYKDEITYGEWIEAGTNKVDANDNLEVKTYQVDMQEESKDCSSESTTKPESLDNRVIKTRVATKTTTKKVCSGGSTYTKTLTKWDNSAYSCRSYGIGKVVCTYKTKKTCTNKKTTSKVTYYSYCDTITKTISKTFYQTRTISSNRIYTDYILESEIPSGYTKLPGSDIIQYRYREKCGK